MPTIDYLLYAEGGSPNVVTQSVYLSAAWRTSGFTPGLAQSAEANKVWRQSSFMATALATFVSQTLGVDVLDDGNLSGFVANLISAVALVPHPARVVTSNANFTLSSTDYSVALDRAAPIANQTITLPISQNGQEFVIEDAHGNFNAFPVIVSSPGGTTIAAAAAGAGASNYVFQEDFGSIKFRFYSGNSKWTVRVS